MLYGRAVGGLSIASFKHSQHNIKEIKEATYDFNRFCKKIPIESPRTWPVAGSKAIITSISSGNDDMPRKYTIIRFLGLSL